MRTLYDGRMIGRENMLNLKISTKVVHGCKGCDPHTGAVSFPIYQSATFRHPGLHQTTGYDYSRLQNPTREELENTIAQLENARFGFAFSSGMAAVSSVLTLFSPGDHLIVSNDLYGGTYRIFESIYSRYGIRFTYLDTSNIMAVKNALEVNTKAIFVETPSNPMMRVTDLRKMAALTKSNKILLIVDNTFLTPYFQRPISLGANIVLHSATKYLGGHNDTLAGLVVTDDEALASSLKEIQKSEGAVLSPFDSWLILRGIKTLALRMEKQQENALRLSYWLKAHPKITHVHYVGLPDHPSYDISRVQSSGFGAMVSFNVAESSHVEKILEKIQVILFAESLGGVESLMTYPDIQTHSAIPEEMRESLGINSTLLRLSVGIEDIEDLIADLAQALE